MLSYNFGYCHFFSNNRKDKGQRKERELYAAIINRLLSLIKEKNKIIKSLGLCLAENGQVHSGQKFVQHFVYIAIFCDLSKVKVLKKLTLTIVQILR